MARPTSRFRRQRNPALAWHQFGLIFTFLLMTLLMLAIILLPPTAK